MSRDTVESLTRENLYMAAIAFIFEVRAFDGLGFRGASR